MKLTKELVTDSNIIENSSTEVNFTTENELMRAIIKSLKDTMEEKNLVYLTAPQIGFNKRIFCIRFDTEIKTFINPAILRASGIAMTDKTTCLSLPGKTYLVPYNPDIDVAYMRPSGEFKCRRFVGVNAYMMRHCIDHLSGVLLSDYALEVDEETYDHASQEEKDELINLYLDEVKENLDTLNQEIESDEMLKKTSDAIKFMDKVRTGEVELVPIEPDKQNNEVKRE